MNRNSHNPYGFIGNSGPPHPVLDLNGFTPGYVNAHLQTGHIAIHPGTGILPIDEIPVFAGFDLPIEADLPTPTGSRPNKPRRRRTADGDIIKHRRTRNGCYTCRGRRIKCDEGRPICERCRKGSRDCVYPDAPPPKLKSKSPKESPKSPTSPPLVESPDDEQMIVDNDEADESVASGDGHDTEASQHLKEESPATTVSQLAGKAKLQEDLATDLSRSIENPPGFERQRKPTSSSKKVNFDSGAASHPSPGSSHASGLAEKSNDGDNVSLEVSPVGQNDSHTYSQLLPELRDLMRYHNVHLGFHHYFFRQDASQFVKDLLPTAALGYEPLLYAVCGFAAYHRAVAQDGKIEDFLGYYQRAVLLLLKSLKSGQEHTEATLITILQLATFEEYLGDWVNLSGHLAAAKELLFELYTPETIVATETRRKIFSWYSRFDIFVGMASGHQSTLDKEWFLAIERWHYKARAMEPSSVDLQIRWLVAYKRALGLTLTELTSQAVAGKISKADFALQYNDLMKQEAAWGQHVVPLAKTAEATEPLPSLRTINPDEMDEDNTQSWPKDLDQASCLYVGSAWGVNLMYMDLYSTSALQRFSYASIMGLPETAREARTLLKEECRMIDALINSRSSPEGSIFCVHAILALLAMFLKDEPEYQNWCRQKLADLEDLGYFFPPLFRTRLAASWNDPSVCSSWQPGGPGRPIIESLRTFNKEREAQPRDQQGRDVKNLRGLFNSLNFDEEPAIAEEQDGTKIQVASASPRHELDSTHGPADKLGGEVGVDMDSYHGDLPPESPTD